MLLKAFLCVFLCMFHLPIIYTTEDNYYELLGVEKTADIKEIRKAFKQLAVQKHPDKNKDDPSAHEIFLKLAEAYDVLKDPVKRNEYDLYGKNTVNYHQPKYHSFNYYKDYFGIYDEDPLIVTLNENEFDNAIGDGIWFVNFYSPLCSHCHHLAADWRSLSELLEGVVKIGAVNCEDDRALCWDIPIHQFPTLLFFEEGSNKHSGEEYDGRRTTEHMEKYILHKIEHSMHIPELIDFSQMSHVPWALFLCPSEADCPILERIRLAAKMNGLVSVGYTTNAQFIKEIRNMFGNIDTKLIFWDQKESTKAVLNEFYYANNLGDGILNMLPEVQSLDHEEFKAIRSALRTDSDIPWLLCFTLGADKETSIILKRLAGRLADFKIGEINCGMNTVLCGSLRVTGNPMWGILKKGGAFEAYTGQSTLHAVEQFAIDAQEAINFHTLSPIDVERIISQGSPWMICWLLTGCPPCKKLITPMRKASGHFTPDVVQFGVIDCKFNPSICNLHRINSFPIAVLYNASSTITYTGNKNENEIVEFIQMQRENLVIKLTPDNFNEEVMSEDGVLEAFLIEFIAPRCAPCQRLQPEWIKLAKKLSDVKTLKIGYVDCDRYSELCQGEGITNYPTIRMYPLSFKIFNEVKEYQIPATDYLSLQKWVISIMSSVTVNMNANNFLQLLSQEGETRTWVVMFYAPWCGFCHQFEPDFLLGTQKLNKIVVAGKVNCQNEGALCHSEYINSYPTVKLYQKINGKTSFNGIEINAYTYADLVEKIKVFTGSTTITPVDHDEL